MAKAEGPVVPDGSASIYIDGAWRDVPLIRRASLRAGHEFSGPAVVMQDDCTTCVLPGYDASIDGYGIMHIERGQEEGDAP